MGIIEDAKKKVQELLDKTDLDEKAVETFKDLTRKGQEFLDRTNLDEKAAEAFRDLQLKGRELLDKTDLDEKIADGARAVKSSVESFFADVQKEEKPLSERAKDVPKIIVEDEDEKKAE